MEKINFEEWLKRKDKLPESAMKFVEDLHRKHSELLANIKARLPELEQLLEKANAVWGYEDPIYRFYHHSFKVYSLQDNTREIVDALYLLAPDGTTINAIFHQILTEGGISGKKFEHDHNQAWTQHTRPFVEAFFHARFFLEMAVRYGRKLDMAPDGLPSGWAALLYLYNIR
jgi:hypothetical protein